MFFRRQRPKEPTFEERLETLRQCGFSTEPQDGRPVRVSRRGIAAAIEPGQERPKVDRAGLVMGAEIAALIDGGYQKFWQSPGGKRVPALASQLMELHEFEEDLREALGLESLYNESLGTTFDYHMYDRVRDRDLAVRPARPWTRSAGDGSRRPGAQPA